MALRKILWTDEVPWLTLSTLPNGPTTMPDGGRAKHLVHTKENGSPDVQFYIGLFELEPGEYHPRHYHPVAAEFYYVLSGTGEFVIDGEVVQGRAGLSIYMPARTRHAVRATGAERLQIVYGFDPPTKGRDDCVWEE